MPTLTERSTGKIRETHFDPNLFDAFGRIARKQYEKKDLAEEAQLEEMLDDIPGKYLNNASFAR
ncbi:MAG: hypothetical protein ACYC7L_01405 [Nitrospirota bacterium]